MRPQGPRDIRRELLDFMGSRGYRPATLKDLFRLLRVGKEHRQAFKRLVKNLAGDGELVKVDHNRFALRSAPASSRSEVVGRDGRDGAVATHGRRERPGLHAGRGAGGGHAAARHAAAQPHRLILGRLSRNPRGFGFVSPDAGGRDVFVPPRALGDTIDGDRVAIRIVREDGQGRAEGEVVRVVERSRKRVLGVFRAGHGRGPGSVEAYDRLYPVPIEIAPGDEGAARDGMVVGVAMETAPSEREGASGRIVEVLGFPDEPGMDLKTIVRKYDLRQEFPPDVLTEAEAVGSTVSEEEIRKREDFRHLPIVTIDGETAKDFDDAVHVAKNPDGTYELQVHIADVAYYVRPSTPLDREAYERGTSVYFPGTALPMLPHALSNGICSLNPRVDRLVQSCIMTIDKSGAVGARRFAQGVIRTVERMTYTAVRKILVDRDPETLRHYHGLVPSFRLMEELCLILAERRRLRGSIDFDLPEPEVVLAMTGEMTGIVPLERSIAHRIIEEFMLAANETVASHLWKSRVPSIYRIHERPDPKKLEDFDSVARAFGYRLQGPFESIRPGAFQAIVDLAKGKPEERFLTRLMLRSMKQARYAEKKDIHFGLATSCYTHFTSPIRRYPDLIVHRLLRRALTGAPLADKERTGLEEFLPEAAVRSSRMERNADAAENELIEWKKLAFMANRLGEEFEGFILSIHPFGFFVELVEYFIDGVVKIESLLDDRYRFIEKKQILKGDRHGRTFKLGDKVRVRLDRADQFQLRLEFSLVEPGRPAAGGAPKKQARSAEEGRPPRAAAGAPQGPSRPAVPGRPAAPGRRGRDFRRRGGARRR